MTALDPSENRTNPTEEQLRTLVARWAEGDAQAGLDPERAVATIQDLQDAANQLDGSGAALLADRPEAL